MKEYGLSSNPRKVEDFIWEVATQTTKDIMEQVGLEFQKQFWVKKGTVLPMSAFTQEGCIWEMIHRYSDAPWNELFVRENRTMDGKDRNPELVFRPTPWFDYEDNPLPDFDDDTSVSYWSVPLADVVSLSAHRDDAELINHVWVTHPLSSAITMTQLATNAGEVDQSGGVVTKATRQKFGDRAAHNLTTSLNPVDIMHPISLPAAEQRAAEKKIVLWVKDRRDWAKKAHEDIHKFERGTLTMKGYPHPRVGDYFRLARGDIVWDGYIVGITHQYNSFHQYLTTLEYIRGNQWKKRQEITQPWDKERKQGLI